MNTQQQTGMRRVHLWLTEAQMQFLQEYSQKHERKVSQTARMFLRDRIRQIRDAGTDEDDDADE